jgi:tetratricopeptide (TPR) repeat protein
VPNGTISGLFGSEWTRHTGTRCMPDERKETRTVMSSTKHDPPRLLGVNEWPSHQRSWVSLQVLAVLSVIGFILALNVLLFVPAARNEAEYVWLRAQSAIRRRLPHPQYLPTPAAIHSAQPMSAPNGVVPSSPTPGPTVLAQRVARQSAAALLPATATPMPTPTATPLPDAVQLGSSRHEAQGWNNCGPATLAMALHYDGIDDDQYTIAAVLKPDKNDKNVSPRELAQYAKSLGGMEAVMGYGTDIEVLKLLLSNGYPVIVETWFIPEPGDEMGHYRLLSGYDDGAQQFTAQDAYHGPDQVVGYGQFDDLWKVFNRVYVVVTEAGRVNELRALLGQRIDVWQMHTAALDAALSDVVADPEDRYAWFNAGTNYLALGRPAEAAAAYDQARTLSLPWRVLWYQFGPFEAYQQVGRYRDTIELANANLKSAKNLEESYYYRAIARRALGDEAGARTDLEIALRYNPNYARAAAALGE